MLCLSACACVSLSLSRALSALCVSPYQGLALCSGFVLLVAVLLPVIIFTTLHTKHGRTRLDGGLGQPSDVQKFGWLFMRYSHSYYWWEVLTMYKTIMTVFFAVWMSHEPGRCVGVVGFCLFLQLVLQFIFKPMECLESEEHSSVKPAKRKGNQLPRVRSAASPACFAAAAAAGSCCCRCRCWRALAEQRAAAYSRIGWALAGMPLLC